MMLKRRNTPSGPGLWAMDAFTKGDFPVGDYPLLEDCPDEDECAFASAFVRPNDVRMTQLHCDGADTQNKKYDQTEKNADFDICSMWCSKPVSDLHDYCDAIKIYIFWPLLFKHEHTSVIPRFHQCVELSNSHPSEINLRKLQCLELMEDIVDLAKKVSNDSFLIEGLLKVGYKIENKMLAMEEALNWIKHTGDATILPKLGSIDSSWPLLSIFFTEYKYYITKVVMGSCDLLEELRSQNCTRCIEQGELMKIKGNEEFSKERFDIAIIYYTRAIEYRPDNHFLYGNRALCFLRTGQLRNALGDGKRATILKCSWPKGHYRYCTALTLLGEYDWALQANIKAQKLCKNDREGIKELIQQHVKLQKQIEDLQGRTRNKNPIKAFYESRAQVTRNSRKPSFSTSLSFVERGRDCRKANREMAYGGSQNMMAVYQASGFDDCYCLQSEFVRSPSYPPRHRGRHKSRNNESENVNSNSELAIDWKKLLEREFSKTSRAAQQDFANVMKMLRSLIQDGYTALLDRRCRSAAQSFSELLNGLDPQKIKQLDLAMINYVLVVYGLAMSLLGIGRSEELYEAENQFKRILQFYPNEGLDSLAYCGIGKVYLKKNRYQEALTHFEKAKDLIYRLPGVLSWPTTNAVIEESQPNRIKMILEKFVEECKFPPVPDAICSYQKCLGLSKIQIYVTDPDFKGFIRISCCQYCKIEFHINCWKKLKSTTFNDKIDKDFLQGVCLTPDCEGIISKIIIFSRGGRVKCEFEHKVIKEKVPPRPILKQKCSSLEKLKLKEDKKMKRKIQKQEAKKLAQEKREEDLRESNQPKKEQQKDTAKNVQHYPFLDDRILHCLKQYSDKIQSGILDHNKVLKELIAWKVWTTEDYGICFSNKNFLAEAVDYVINYLIQARDRVKTRIFLHILCELEEVEPTAASWLQKLDSFGLDATGTFFTRYGSLLKDLDFTIMSFLWKEKYGDKLDSIEGKSLEYFCEPTSLKEGRFLIWLLEDHREKFPALQSALDEFFDIMDSRCTVLRKQDNEVPITSTKTKNKGKKKRQKDTKLMLIGSVTTSLTPSNETSGYASNRPRGDPTGPFAVPEHLRQEIEEFEALYAQRHANDHLTQYVEDTEPVQIGNKIITEEYEFFPEETRKILEQTGSLKSFLLGCPHFVVIDNCIALRKVTLRLKKRRKKRNMKARAEEISKIEESLRAKLWPNQAAGGPQPDGQSSPVPDAAPAPDPKDTEPKDAEPKDTEPKDAEPKDVEPKNVEPRDGSANPPSPVCEDKKLKSGPESSASPVSTLVNSEGVSCDSPKPLPKAATPAYWAQSHMVTTFCTYLPFQGFGISQTPPAYMNVLPSLPRYTSIYTPLAGISSDYQRQRAIVPLVPPFLANDRLKKNALLYFKDPNLNAEKAAGKPVTSEMQIPKNSGVRSGKSQSNSSETHTSSDSRCKVTAESAPHTREAAVQVAWPTEHQEVNTEPYVPVEVQQGDISQIEKEYYVLQEQLKEACENYEQIKLIYSEETRNMEEKLKKNLQENKISETELDWFIRDLEAEVTNWEQEKKEIQDRLKTMKKKIKKVWNANEIQAFINERMQMENGKGGELYEESHQRALVAEVSVLENWKEGEIYKLQNMASKAEAYLKNLRSSDSAAYPNKESDIHSWESFISNVAKEIMKAKSQFEDQIRAIKNGSRLRELPQVRVSELSFPACKMVRPQLVAAPPSPESQGAGASASSAPVPGASHKDCPEEAPSAPVPSAQLEVAPPAQPKRAGQAVPSVRSPEVDQTQPVPAGPTPRSNQHTKKLVHAIIERLSAIFPCYNSTELAIFIKQVGSKNKNSFAGLSVNDIIQRVTEHILDEQKEEKPNPEKDKGTARARPAAAPAAAAAAAAAAGTTSSRSPLPVTTRPPATTNRQKPEAFPVQMQCQGPRAGKEPQTPQHWQQASAVQQRQRAPCQPKLAPRAKNTCEMCHEVFKSKNIRVLKCGHKFHKGCFKQWLKGHGTCPTCHGGALLPKGQ